MEEELVRAFVTKADGNIIRVKILDSTFAKELSQLGFSLDTDLSEYITQIADGKEKAQIFDKLRNLNVSFSSGKEWCPSEVFEYLRDEGLLSGSFSKISWSSPGKYHLTVV